MASSHLMSGRIANSHADKRTRTTCYVTHSYNANPVAAQRRLRVELRHLRERQHLTQQQVADALEISLSKVIRMENGIVHIQRNDLDALLRLYQVSEKKQVEDLLTIARVSRQEAWWDRYRSEFNRRFITTIGLEASASVIRQFQLLLIPGLLQTEDYARTIISTYDTDEDGINLGVRVRMERQQLLDADLGQKLFFIVDEAAIRRQVGGPSVMREQLVRLKELNRRPNISIQVIPFSKGAYLGIRGSFKIFEFDDGYDYAVDVEQSYDSVLIQNSPEESRMYIENFYDLEDLASGPDELDKLIDSVLARSSYSRQLRQ